MAENRCRHGACPLQKASPEPALAALRAAPQLVLRVGLLEPLFCFLSLGSAQLWLPGRPQDPAFQRGLLGRRDTA